MHFPTLFSKKIGALPNGTGLASGLLFFLCLMPNMAHAFQPHNYKGLFVHQLAHVFLIISLATFALKAKHSRFAFHQAWSSITAGAWLLVVWGFVTMVGHFLDLSIARDSLVVLPGDSIPTLRVNSWKDILFFVFKMDNLIAVPAVILIYIGFKSMRGTVSRKSANRKTQPR